MTRTTNASAPSTPLLSTGQFADLLQVSKRQIQLLNRDGVIPAPIRIGGSVRWRTAEILAWMRAGAPTRAKWEKMEVNYAD